MDGPLRVLTIEDSAVVQEALTDMVMQDSNIIVEKAGNLRDGLLRLSQGGIDVVMLDLYLPDARDLEALNTTREKFPAIPVVVVTGMGRLLELEAMAAGAEDFLDKVHVTQQLLVTTLRHAVIRNEVRRKFAFAQAQLKATDEAIRDAQVFEKVVPHEEKSS